MELQFQSNSDGHMKPEFVLKLLPKRWIDAIESATQRLPHPLRKRISLQTAVLFRKANARGAGPRKPGTGAGGTLLDKLNFP